MPTPLEPTDPREVGPYRLCARVGVGGTGVVYQGISYDGRLAAVKLSHHGTTFDAELRRRFEREVSAARRVRGSGVALVLAVDVTAARPWMATEYVDGVSLAAAVSAYGPVEAASLGRLATGLAEGVHSIHTAGLVHCDLNPSNIVLGWDGPKVVDFGAARAVDAAPDRAAVEIPGGTAGWMAPEQISGDRPGASVDVFTWATCVAFAATGRHPFAAESPAETVARVLVGEPDLAGMPDGLEYLVRQALSKDPLARPTPAQLVAVVSALSGNVR